MSLRSIIIICNFQLYERNFKNKYVKNIINYKSLLTERQSHVLMSPAQGNCAEAISFGNNFRITREHCNVNKHGYRGKRQCQKSCTNLSPTSSFSRDD